MLAIAGLALMADTPALAFRPSGALKAKAIRTKAPDFETAALMHLRAQEIEQAIAVLDAAVEREFRSPSPSLRLFDLLGTLYARKQRLEDLTALTVRMEVAARRRSDRFAVAMHGRAGNWRDEGSKWRRDRANPQATIKWRGGKFAKQDDIVIAA